MTQLFIDGKWADSDSGKTVSVTNPATGDEVAEVARAGESDVDRAVTSANQAFNGWSSASGDERGEYLHKIADLMRERKRDMARILTKEQGKPVSEAEGEISASIKAYDYYGRKAHDIGGEIIPTGSSRVRSFIEKQPIGPVAAIAPWNYPVLLLSWKVAPALAAGCTLVAKPSTETPLAVSELFKCIDEAGLPHGVANMVIGRGSEVGSSLVNHPDIRKVAFTGQTETGRRIMRDAASDIKDVTLELGSSGPLIVASDADVRAAAESAAYRGFRNMGQICNSVNRVYVHEDNYDEFLEIFLEVVSDYEIADGVENPDADLGPMVNEAGIEKTKRHIRDALDRGAQLQYGGEPPEGPKYENGNFFMPTVLTDVDHDMLVMTEETFGPVVPIMKVGSVDEAIGYSNDTIYGLVAYLFIDDRDRGMDIAEELEYGTVGINNVSGGDVPYPYSGWKQSGLGVELSEYGLEEYLEIKHIRAKSFS